MENKKIKYTLWGVLSLSALIIVFFIARNIYSLNAYKIYLLSPEKNSVVSSEFTATLLIAGKKTPEFLRVYLDNEIVEAKTFDSLNVCEVEDLKLINIKIDPVYLNNGIHRAEFEIKGNWFAKDSRVGLDFGLEKLPSKQSSPSRTEIKRMQNFFSGEVTDYIVKLNNARYYYIPSEWKKSGNYLSARKKVLDADINDKIKTKLSVLMDSIESSADMVNIYNAANSLNLALYTEGYPLHALMFEYRYENGEVKSLLLPYASQGKIKYNKYGINEYAFLITRLDSLKQKEQFLGLKMPNSPFAYVVTDIADEVAVRYGSFFSKNNEDALYALKKLSGFSIKDDKVYSKFLSVILAEARDAGWSEKNTKDFVYLSNSFHEIKHLYDYKNAIRISRSVPLVLNYFYGRIKEGNSPFRDSSFSIERSIAETLLRINPEFSAYLFELKETDGMRKVNLLSLFEKVINQAKLDTPHHWAGKLIIYLLAKKNGLADEDLLLQPADTNIEKWNDIIIKLMDLSNIKLYSSLKEIYEEEFE